MKILLTGATGYIGRRLKDRLLKEKGIHLRLFVRNAQKISDTAGDNIEIFEGSTFDKESLNQALAGIDAAYYLIHSMGSKGDFSKLDRQSAENFLAACIEKKVRRIIYLGGLGKKDTASKHLLSRIETGEILSSRPRSIQTIWFRAGIIIGSGSASFEIIHNLVQKIPLLITPKWVNTKTQPISIKDVLEYLVRAKDIESRENLIVDIGSEQMTFKTLLKEAAKVMGLKRILITFPPLTPKLSAYGLIFITPVSFRIAAALVKGLKSETIIQNDNAKKYFPFISPVSYTDAIKIALAEIENKQVISRWCDSSAKEVCDLQEIDQIETAVYVEKKVIDIRDIPAEKVFAAVQTLGGENGWFKYSWLWKLRGFIDNIVGGPGLNRGRRDPYSLRTGDSLDFWKVKDLREGSRLLLSSQMKLPGKGWLEYSVAENNLIQTVYFLPKGLWGRLYWHLISPFHKLIFADLTNGILDRAKKL